MPIQIKGVPLEIQPGRPDINYAAILEQLQQAQQEKVDLLILPQLCLSGKLLGSAWQEEDLLQDCLSYGQELIAATGETALLFGNLTYAKVVHKDGVELEYYPTICLAQHGQLIAEQLYDARDLNSQLECLKLSWGEEKLTLGCTLVDRTAEDLPQLAKAGAQLLITLDATSYQPKQEEELRDKLQKLSQSIQCPLLYLNQSGIQNTGKNIYAYSGLSLAYDTQGQLLAATTAFSLRSMFCCFDNGEFCSSIGIAPALTGMEAVYRCLHYGAKSFLQQCGIKKMTIGLSGGIDSAVTAALYGTILGPDNILLLNLPSVYNSSTTKDLAKSLAYNLGAQYGVVPIQESYEHTVAQLESLKLYQGVSLQKPLVLSGLVKENIQARDRGARVIAAAAAAFGGAFSCNSNKTEMTIGYCTFYGDLAGALALIGDLWKDQVYALGRYLNEEVFQREVIPEEIFIIRPSAELSSTQTVGQGGDPLHYDYHNRLFQRMMEATPRATPADVLRWYKAGTLEQELHCPTGLIETYFPTAQAFIEDLERWWRLFTGFSVAKRIQAPPIMSLSPRPYGNPFPEAQLQPYFSREYQQLKAELLI